MPSLPREMLVARIAKEIDDARRSGPHFIELPPGGAIEIPQRLVATLLNAPGPVWDGKVVSDGFVHRLELTIGPEYPYVRPQVRWLTPIFHPNIMMPDEGGLACVRLLKDWRFDSSLTDLLRGLARLVAHPQPDEPFTTPACSAAAKYFGKAPYAPPRSALSQG